MRKLILAFSLMLATAGLAAAQVPDVSTAAAAAKKKPTNVPELDGSIAAVAVALIGGGFAVAHGRRRKARS
jgi:hypothetical protein